MVDSRGGPAAEPEPGPGVRRVGGGADDGPACVEVVAPEGRLACPEPAGLLLCSVVGTARFACAGRGCCCACEAALGLDCEAPVVVSWASDGIGLSGWRGTPPDDAGYCTY